MIFRYIESTSYLNPTTCVVSGRKKMQFVYGTGNFRQNRVSPGNGNKKLWHFLLSALFNADKSAVWTNFTLKTSQQTVNHSWRTKSRPDLDLAGPNTPILTIFSTKSRTLQFAQKLSSLGIHYKSIPDPEPTLPEESTHHYRQRLQ